MNAETLNKIKVLKEKFQQEGFIILGFFGSYARGEETTDSDIDLLYEMTTEFYQKYPGWDVIPVLDRIENECSRELGKTVDMANKNALNEVGKKYILPEVIYV
jgi:predicted nucleotidyltransferase